MKKYVIRIISIVLLSTFLLSLIPMTVFAASWKCSVCSAADNVDNDAQCRKCGTIKPLSSLIITSPSNNALVDKSPLTVRWSTSEMAASWYRISVLDQTSGKYIAQNIDIFDASQNYYAISSNGLAEGHTYKIIVTYYYNADGIQILNNEGWKESYFSIKGILNGMSNGTSNETSNGTPKEAIKEVSLVPPTVSNTPDVEEIDMQNTTNPTDNVNEDVIVVQEEVNTNKNPAAQEVYNEIVNAINHQRSLGNYMEISATEFIHIVCAVAWTGSGWQQFDPTGSALINAIEGSNNVNVGLMQINNQNILSSSDLEKLMADWKENIWFGIDTIRAAYIEVMNDTRIAQAAQYMDIPLEEAILRSIYSRYDAGPENILRWLTGKNSKDDNFLKCYKNFVNKSWTENFIGFVIDFTPEAEPDKPAEKVSDFKDVPSNAWYAAALQLCLDKKIITRSSNTDFSPDAPVTSGELNDVKERLLNHPAVFVPDSRLVTRTEVLDELMSTNSSLSAPLANFDCRGYFRDMENIGQIQLVVWNKALVNGIISSRGNYISGASDIILRNELTVLIGRILDASQRISNFDVNGNCKLPPIPKPEPPAPPEPQTTEAEFVWFPVDTLRITQLAYESFSHSNYNAIDCTGVYRNTSTYAFAPFTGIIVAHDTSYANVVLFQSINKVYLANGDYDYVTVQFMHGSNTAELKQLYNKIIPQGTKFYRIGNYGRNNRPDSRYGTHFDIQVYKGRISKFNAKYNIGNVFAFNAFYINKNLTKSFYNAGICEAGNSVKNRAPYNYNGLWRYI